MWLTESGRAVQEDHDYRRKDIYNEMPQQHSATGRGVGLNVHPPSSPSLSLPLLSFPMSLPFNPAWGLVHFGAF